MEIIKNPIKHNKKTVSILATIGGISLLVSMMLIIFILIQNRNLKEQLAFQNSQLKTQTQKNQETNVEMTKEDLLKQKEIDYFVEDILPQYPQLENISTNSILNIYTFTLRETGNQSSGWLVETENSSNKSYYLVSDLV